MDIPASSRGFPPVPVLRKKSLYGIPFLGSTCDARATCRLSVPAPRFAQEHDREWPLDRQRGVSVLLFPEGGRSPHGLRDFKDGAATSPSSRRPVVPIAIVGMRPLLPMGSIHIRRGTASCASATPSHRASSPPAIRSLPNASTVRYRTCSKIPFPHPRVKLESWALRTAARRGVVRSSRAAGC